MKFMDKGFPEPYVDPQSRTDFDRNGAPIKVRQSKFLVLEPAPELKAEVDKLLDGEPGIGLGSFYNPDEGISEIVPLVFKFLIDNPEAVDFIIDHVIAKSEGPVDGELRDEILKLLGNMNLWVIRDEFMIEDRQFRATNGEKGNAASPDLLHVDMSPETDIGPMGPSLRVTIPKSSQKATVGYRGWFDTGGYERGGDVRAAEGSELFKVDPGDGAAVIWETQSGIHQSPEMTETDWQESGGSRGLYSLSVYFHKLVYVAKQNIENRTFSKQEPEIPVPPMPLPPEL